MKTQIKLKLPSGRYTTSRNKHIKEWRDYTYPLLKVLEANWVGIGNTKNYDFIQIEFNGKIIGLSKELIIKLVELIEC